MMKVIAQNATPAKTHQTGNDWCQRSRSLTVTATLVLRARELA
jgi:hypothetical protein